MYICLFTKLILSPFFCIEEFQTLLRKNVKNVFFFYFRDEELLSYSTLKGYGFILALYTAVILKIFKAVTSIEFSSRDLLSCDAV
jgi:hypothetical protein